MSISHADFFRVLPAAMGEMRFHQSGLRVEATEGTHVVIIELSEERPRRLGVFTLPSVTVTIEWRGFGESEWAKFLLRFDRAFQRGGG